MDAPKGCSHLDQVRDVSPSAAGCKECRRVGSGWFHLRMCLSCGKVGCCDNSPNRRATAHARESGHSLIRSIEPGGDWMYCYPDDMYLELEGVRAGSG